MNNSPSTEYTLALIRVVSCRLKQIDEEVLAAGIALSRGLIDPEKACQMVEEVAPGCIDVVARSILEGAAS
jgi:hypothetical protein